MTDRVLSALRSLGIQTPPVATLEREDGFFALLPDLLVYQDEQGTRRVTLRDLTRIHSDAEGVLRVETPAGTALTANLLGFEPGEVQGFFAGVRDATAQAKNLPPAPLPTPGGFKTFGSVPKLGMTSQIKEAPPVPPAPPVAAEPAPQARVVPDPPRAEPTPPEPTRPEQSRPEPSRAAPPKAAPPKFGQARQAQDKAAPREPVQTAKSSVTVVSADPGPAPTTAPVAAPPASVSSAGVQTGLLPQEVRPDVVPARPVPVVGGPASSGRTELGTRAAAVQGLPSRLQVLAVVLGLAAVGLAYFQYQAGAPLGGLWTLIAGGVGSVALFVFAEVTRLIVTLARTVAGAPLGAESGTDDSGA